MDRLYCYTRSLDLCDRLGSSGWLFLTWQWTDWLHERPVIFLTVGRLLACREGFCVVELFSLVGSICSKCRLYKSWWWIVWSFISSLMREKRINIRGQWHRMCLEKECIEGEVGSLLSFFMMTRTHTPVFVRRTSQGRGEGRTDFSFLRVISEAESFSIWNKQHQWHLFS